MGQARIVLVVKPFYNSGRITIYHADCADVIPIVPPDTVDLLLTDPPYGIGLTIGLPGKMHGRTHNGGRSYAPIVGDDRPFDPLPLLRYPQVFLWGANHFAHVLPPGQWVVWRKRGASEFMAAAELAWHNLGRRSVDYFETTRNESRRRDGHIHPAQKPVSLMRWIIEKWTDPGDLIFDPYMGSGPIAQACYELGRRYVGVEIVEEYCEAAARRLNQQVMQL